MNFLQNSNPIDPSQFQNQRFPNGIPRNASPAQFHQSQYNVNPVIPTKRPRELEDGFTSSPRPAPGGLPGSRSQTPAQNQFSNFHPGANGAPTFAQPPTPFQHLQGTPSVNMTPSPNAQTQHFNQAGGPQRVGTASPSPFSPHPGPQMSPSHDPSRVPTPHDNPGHPNHPNHPNPYMQPGGFPPNMPQQFAPNPQGMHGGQMPMNPQFNQMSQQMAGQRMSQQQAYQMQMQAQARQMQAQAVQNRPGSSGMGHPGGMPPNMNNAVMQGMQQQAGIPKLNPDVFNKQLQNFMAQRGQPVEIHPVLFGRPIVPFQLYSLVLKHGGASKISKTAPGWVFIAQQLGFPAMQQGPVAVELQRYYMQNLGPYEMAWMASKQHQRQEHMRMTSQGQIPNQMSPTKMEMPGPEPNSHFGQGPQPAQNGLKSMPNNVSQAPPDNFQNGVQVKNERQVATPNQHRLSLSRPVEPQQPNGLPNYAMPSPAKRLDTGAGKDLSGIQPDASMPPKRPIEDPFKPDVLPESTFHGPINVQEIYGLGEMIATAKPTVPDYREMGLIDIHALIMGLKSGIHAEIRVSLDALTILSAEGHLQLSLDNCDDLVEALIDCAQDQFESLAEHTVEVSDEIDLLSYEDVVRGCHMEASNMLDVPEFASLDYDLDRSADRLICITTLLRNFSFYEANFNVLGMPDVIKFMTTVIRYLGTRTQFLRNHRNTLDFMKDVVIFLSNLSHSVELPSKEEATCLLHFLLAFAPCPAPITAVNEKIFFPSYNPQIHKYMPAALDSMAKLLARDEPNRTFYKSIFATDGNASQPHSLLTRSFGLAIAPIPDVLRGTFGAVVEARKPFIFQGMLAAEILTSLAPGSESNLARSWLESTDGWAVTLLRLIQSLSSDKITQSMAQRLPPNRQAPENDTSYGSITHRGIIILRRLAEKSRMGENGDLRFPVNVLPKKDTLLGALGRPDVDPFVVRQICIYAEMQD